MNSYMNITIRVLSNQAAAAIRARQTQLAALAAQSAVTGAAIDRGFPTRNLVKFGNQLQWTGRQLQYNFTLPIALAGAAAAKFALDNEKAFTKVVKVYGDVGMAQQQITNETNALRKAFVELSNHFGVQQKEVLDVAAAWAAAGASGLALAQDVKLTMETMILGEMSAAEATDALIAIQSQYNQSTKELTKTIEILNMVENQTGISLQGLVQGMSRAAGTAAMAGIDVRHLAAMLAAMTPAAGTAAQAGNALKTIISRLFQPTKDATTVLGLMGINVKSAAWQAKNGSQRMEELANQFVKLNGSTKTMVSGIIASRFQINKFGVLMDAMATKTKNGAVNQSFYTRALQSTSDQVAVYNQMQKELNLVLSSNPQRLKQIWTILQNAMADVIQPAIPLILAAADTLRKLVEAFKGLPPEVQKAVMMMLLFLALFGPVLRYVGSTITLIGEMGKAFAVFLIPLRFVIGGLGSLTGVLTGGVAAALGGVSAALFAAGRGFMFLGGIIAPLIAGFSHFVAIIVGPLMSTLGVILSASFIALGRRLVTIWTATFALLSAISSSSLVAMGAIFTSGLGTAITASAVAFWRTLTGIWILGSAAILAASRSLWLTALFHIQTFFIAASRIAALGSLAFAVNLRAGFFVALAFLKGLPALVMSSGPALFAAMRALSLGAVAAFASPWGLAIAAVVGVLYFFRKQIEQIITNVIEAFYQLPPSILQALKATVDTIKAAAMAAYQWLQYLNPFARHSPSLVDNVRSGMAIVRQELASVTSVSGALSKSASDLQKYGRVIANLKQQMNAAQTAEDRANLGKVSPGALGAFDALNADLALLNRSLVSVKAAVDAQQSVVNQWAEKLDRANAALDAQQNKLDRLQDNLSKYQDLLSSAKDRLSTFASTPIKGMQAMSDAIFANSMAQKRLQLEMLKMDDAVGGIDKVRGRLDKLNGEMELARGTAAALREKGAGSDILGAYNDQISAIDRQKKSIETSLAPYDELQARLDDLARQGQILDLTNSLKFDPLTRQIENAANAMKELPFSEIMAGIRGARADVDKYQAAVNAATAAVDKQRAVVDAATAARDAIAARYDAEQKQLDGLQAKYDAVKDSISAVEGALRDMTSAAADSIRRQEDALAKARQKAAASGRIDPTAAGFATAAGGTDFASVSGSGGLGRQGIAGDQSAMIDQFTKDLAKSTASMFGAFDIFAPIKKKWNQFTSWLKGALEPVKKFISTTFSGVDFAAPFKKLDLGLIQKAKDAIVGFFTTLVDWGGKIWDLLGPDIMDLGKNLWAGVKSIWDQIQPEFAKFGELVKPLGSSLSNVWKIVKPILVTIGVMLLGVASTLLHVLASVIKPVFEAIGGILAGFLRVVRGVLKIVVGLFTGDLGMMAKGVKDIFMGLVKIVVSLITGLGKTLWGLVKGIVQGIVNFFKWLWDVLVGHSIIPDMVNGIVNWIKKLGAIPRWIYDNMLKPFYDRVSSWWSNTLSPKVSSIATGVTNFFKTLGKIPSWLYDNALKPVYDRFNSIWEKNLKPLGNRMIRGFANIFNSIGNAITKGVNIGINAINKLIGGLNWVGSHVPGLDFSIGLLGTAAYNPWTPPQFARGGSLPMAASKVGAGFKTHGIRAIVGEGNPAHPEFVIPTDPKYRGRATNLLAQAAKEVGIGFESGGILGQITNAVLSSGSDLARGAIDKVFKPIMGKVNDLLSKVDNRLHLRDIMQAGVKNIMNWTRSVDGALPPPGGPINSKLGSALDFAKASSGRPYVWGGVGPNGFDCSGFMSAITNYIQGRYPYTRRFATGNFPTSDFAKGPGAFMIGSRRGNPGHMAGTLNGVNVESSGGIGTHYGSTARGARDSLFGGNIWHLKGYAAGGRIGDPAFDLLAPAGKYFMGNAFRRLIRSQTYDTGGTLRPGLTLAYNGTGRNEQVLTQSQMRESGQRTITFNGDLVFPNVTNGDDAEDFIKNLEVLAGGM